MKVDATTIVTRIAEYAREIDAVATAAKREFEPNLLLNRIQTLADRIGLLSALLRPDVPTEAEVEDGSVQLQFDFEHSRVIEGAYGKGVAPVADNTVADAVEA